jgi:hypothetical protein
MIVFRVADTSTSRHELNRSSPQRFFCAYIVLMRQLAMYNVGDDLHVPMRMRSKSSVRLDKIVIHDPQYAIIGIAIVVIFGKRKMKPRLSQFAFVQAAAASEPLGGLAPLPNKPGEGSLTKSLVLGTTLMMEDVMLGDGALHVVETVIEKAVAVEENKAAEYSAIERRLLENAFLVVVES